MLIPIVMRRKTIHEVNVSYRTPLSAPLLAPYLVMPMHFALSYSLHLSVIPAVQVALLGVVLIVTGLSLMVFSLKREQFLIGVRKHG